MAVRRLILTAFVAFAVAAPGASCAAAPAPTTNAPVQLPFLARGSNMLVRAVVNDSDSLWFILDTGASGNVINQGTAKKLGYEVVPGTHARGAGGTVQAGTVRGARIGIGGFTLDDEHPVVAIDLDPIALRMGHPVDGVIGAPFWRRFAVEIDYTRSQLTLHDPKTYAPPTDAAVLPLSFEHNHPYVTARATLPGGKPVEGRYLLDTGAGSALIFTPEFVEKTKALEHVDRTLTVQFGGVGGRMSAPLGRIAQLELGPFAIERPIAILRTPGGGRTSVEDSHGNIGGEILRRFKPTFDYSRKRIILERAITFAEPFEADMSGLVFAPGDDSPNRVEVLIVQPDSPAAEQGIAQGDVLETVDGQPIAATDLADLRKSLRREGTTVRLGVRRAGTLTERTLVTRRLI